MDVVPGRVAVIGLGESSHNTARLQRLTQSSKGVSGITAVKNLVDQGFDVTGYERNDFIGGLWQFNEDPEQTTALRSMSFFGSSMIQRLIELSATKTNASKQFACRLSLC